MFSLHFRVCRFKKGIWGPGVCVPLWRAAGSPLPTGGQGHERRSDSRRSPPPTGGRGCKLCSGARPGPPCPPGAVGGRAALARGRSSPWLPAAGDARATLARGRSPPAEKNSLRQTLTKTVSG